MGIVVLIAFVGMIYGMAWIIMATLEIIFK